MLKKIISYLLLYSILINLLSGVFFIDISFAKDNDNLKIKGLSQKSINNPDYSTDRVIVKFKKIKGRNTNLATFKSKIDKKAFKKLDYLDKVDVGVLTFDEKGVNIDSFINDLKKLSEVEYVEKDYSRSMSYSGVVTNDPKSIDQWYLKSIQADSAWELYNDTSDKTTVSINDSGIDYTHPDLLGNLKDLSSSCISDSGSIIVGGCANHGWNFEDILYGTTTVLPENDIFDINGHGTHVSGIIGATGNNGTGVIGVTQNVEMIGARLESYNLYDGYFYVSNIIKGINFSIQNGAKIINASYGGPNFSKAEYDAIEIAKNSGVLFITAAGNESNNSDITPSYPDGYDLDNIISVASVGSDDNLAYYSNYGPTTIDVAAPGGNLNIDSGILSTVPKEEIAYENDLSTASGMTQLPTNPDWYLYNSNFGIHTQTPQYYTGGLDYKLFFDDSFSLAGAHSAKLKGYISCDFGSGNFDQDTGDNVNFYIYDSDSGESLWLDTFYKDYTGYVEIPFTNPAFFKENLHLWLHFLTDNDTDVGQGCRIDDLSVVKYSNTSHSYASFQGTSMATPIVSGLAAMLWSYKPDLAYSQVKDLILSSVDLIPSLNGKVLSNGKINAKKAVLELISRYGITKNGTFASGIFATPFINLNGKNVTLSGSSINFNGTGTIISLSGSTISGNGQLNIGTGTSLFNNGADFFNTSNNFDILIKNSSGTVLNNSGTINGESLILDYTGSKIGNLDIHLYTDYGNFIYSGSLGHDITFPVNESFTGGLNAYVYGFGDGVNGISTGVLLKVIDTKTLDNLTFNYVVPQKILTGSLVFASGSLTNNTGTTLNLTSSIYPINYELTGDMVGTSSGILNASGSLSVDLTSGDGVKNLSIVFTSTGGTLNSTGSITLDQTLPSLNFLSYLDNEKVTSSSITLTGTLYDLNGISGFSLNGSGVVLSGYNFTKAINLNPGDNNISYQVIDNAGNISTGSINIIRISNSNNISSNVFGNGLVNISFDSDLSTTGEVLYGTGENIIDLSKIGNTGTNHSIDLTGLTANTQYFYKVRGNNNGYTGTLSSIGSFITPSIYNVDNNSGNTSNTGTLAFIGTNFNSSGALFNSSGSITINSFTGSNGVILSLSGLIINSNGWNGLFNPPTQTSFSGIFNNSGYTHIPAFTYKIGSDESELDLSGTTAQVNIYVGTSYNGKTLGIFRSTNNGTTYNYLITCLVSSGICSFTTDKFSLFTLGTPVVINGGSSSSSSSTSGGGSSSGGSSSMGGFSAPMTVSTCLDTQLVCTKVNGITNTFKYYRGEGVSCEGGNLGNTCSAEEVVIENTQIGKIQSVKYLDDGYEYKSKILKSIFNKEASGLINIDNILSSISYLGKDIEDYMQNYRKSYTKLLDSIHNVDDLLSNKDIIGVKNEFKNFLQIHKELSNFKYDGKVKYLQVNGDTVGYLLYSNSKILKIQKLLFLKLLKKKANTYAYRLVNKVVYNLNSLLTDKSLTNDEIKTIREETISYYKQFIIEYSKLENK